MLWYDANLVQKYNEPFLVILTAMKKLTKQMCWEVVSITRDTVNGVGIAVYRKPLTNECYEQRSQNDPPLCQESDDANAAWYVLSSETASFFQLYVKVYKAELICLTDLIFYLICLGMCLYKHVCIKSLSVHLSVDLNGQNSGLLGLGKHLTGC